MRIRFCSFIIIAGLLLAVSACEKTSSTSVSPTESPQTMPNDYASGQTGYDDPVLHNQFEEIWNGSDGVMHLLYSRPINRVDGGTLAVTPSGWPEGYEIRVHVPAGVIPPSYPGGDEINFGIAIPVDDLNGTGHPSYEFFPDGIVFDGCVEVTVCWPPWAGEPPGEIFEMVFLETEMHEMEIHYRVTDRSSAVPAALLGPEPEGGWTLADRSTEITYYLHHFSRWGVSSGTDDGGEGTDVFLPGTETNEGCWTDYPRDRGGPGVRIR